MIIRIAIWLYFWHKSLSFDLGIKYSKKEVYIYKVFETVSTLYNGMHFHCTNIFFTKW